MQLFKPCYHLFPNWSSFQFSNNILLQSFLQRFPKPALINWMCYLWPLVNWFFRSCTFLWYCSHTSKDHNHHRLLTRPTINSFVWKYCCPFSNLRFLSKVLVCIVATQPSDSLCRNLILVPFSLVSNIMLNAYCVCSTLFLPICSLG